MADRENRHGWFWEWIVKYLLPPLLSVAALLSVTYEDVKDLKDLARSIEKAIISIDKRLTVVEVLTNEDTGYHRRERERKRQ